LSQTLVCGKGNRRSWLEKEVGVDGAYVLGNAPARFHG
jgi:hypothetical protein